MTQHTAASQSHVIENVPSLSKLPERRRATSKGDILIEA